MISTTFNSLFFEGQGVCVQSPIIILLKCVILILSVLIAIAYLTLVERKVMGRMQRRLGPNVVGFYGLMQPFADALKLFLKEVVIPSLANRNLFLGAPVLTLALSLVGWAVIPLAKGVVISDLNLGVLFLLAVSSFGVYGVLFSGWAANSRYALMGSLRSTSQMISYEVALGLLILTVIFCSGSLNLTLIAQCQKSVWFIVPLFPVCLMFYISSLAELNRAPFDLPEAESELTAGFFTEHSAFPFAFFFLGEYGHMVLQSSVIAFFFLGGYTSVLDSNLEWSSLYNLTPDLNYDSVHKENNTGILNHIKNMGFSLISTFSHSSSLQWFCHPSFILGLKVALMLFIMVWVRACLPRMTYFNLMGLMWKSFLPLSMAFFLFVPAVLIVLF